MSSVAGVQRSIECVVVEVGHQVADGYRRSSVDRDGGAVIVGEGADCLEGFRCGVWQSSKSVSRARGVLLTPCCVTVLPISPS
jgi:hypothetical protein